MGLFSFLSGKGDETPVDAPAAPAESKPIEYEEGINPAELEASASFGLNVEALTAPVVDPAAEQPQMGPTDPAVTAELQPLVVDQLKTVFDPEIPVNIHDLGLIYDVIVDANAVVGVVMTLTAPACPAAQWLPSQVEQAVKGVEGVSDAVVDVVFDPPWSKDKMSEAAKLQLGLW